MNPVVAVLLGTLVLGEPLGARDARAAVASILAAVVLIVSARPPAAPTARGRCRGADRERANLDP